jgi:hypothetical protein
MWRQAEPELTATMSRISKIPSISTSAHDANNSHPEKTCQEK